MPFLSIQDIPDRPIQVRPAFFRGAKRGQKTSPVKVVGRIEIEKGIRFGGSVRDKGSSFFRNDPVQSVLPFGGRFFKPYTGLLFVDGDERLRLSAFFVKEGGHDRFGATPGPCCDQASQKRFLHEGKIAGKYKNGLVDGLQNREQPSGRSSALEGIVNGGKGRYILSCPA